jgi:hypothetical protein
VRPTDFLQILTRAIGGGRKSSGEAPALVRGDRRRRDDARIPCDPTLVRIAVEGEFVPVQAQAVNRSEFGVGLQLTRPYPLREGMQITIEMHHLLLTGTIRYCTKERGTGPFRMGVLITDITGPDGRRVA